MSFKVLHVGNIANNAFCAAYEDRQHGIDAFAVNPHLSDPIATPVWEFKNSKCLPENLDEWFISGNWREILKRWNGSKFVVSELYSQRNVLLNSQKSRVKTFVKQKLRAGVRVYLANEILHRVRTFLQPNLYRFFNDFDVIVFYGPYTSLIKFAPSSKLKLAFEHGTLNNFCRAPFKYSRDSLHGFLMADVVLISNQDSLKAVSDFGILPSKIQKSPHPTVELDLHYFRALRSSFLEDCTSKPFILAPARHSLSSSIEVGKGNQIIFQAFANLIEQYPGLKLVCVSNGDDLNYSINLARTLGINHAIEWLPVQTRYELKTLMAKSLCVIDQFNSESYGTITADAILLGVPVLTAHSCELDQVFFGKCAPVIASTSTFLGISEAVQRLLLNRDIHHQVYSDSIDWSDKNLSAHLAYTVRHKLYNTAEKSVS